jgi:hypothetical protein
LANVLNLNPFAWLKKKCKQEITEQKDKIFVCRNIFSSKIKKALDGSEKQNENRNVSPPFFTTYRKKDIIKGNKALDELIKQQAKKKQKDQKGVNDFKIKIPKQSC